MPSAVAEMQGNSQESLNREPINKAPLFTRFAET
jgi:hypothetical protein